MGFDVGEPELRLSPSQWSPPLGVPPPLDFYTCSGVPRDPELSSGPGAGDGITCLLRLPLGFVYICGVFGFFFKAFCPIPLG